jgi:hypothetical protein
MVIRRVGPVSCAKIAGALYALIGFVLGCMFSLVSMAGAFAGGPDSPFGPMSAIFGVGAIVILPILYGCMGFVMTLISAWLYNVLASSVGGIQLELSETGGVTGGVRS